MFREHDDDKMDEAFYDFFLKREAKFLGKVPLETEFDLEIKFGSIEFYLI